MFGGAGCLISARRDHGLGFGIYGLGSRDLGFLAAPGLLLTGDRPMGDDFGLLKTYRDFGQHV